VIREPLLPHALDGFVHGQLNERPKLIAVELDSWAHVGLPSTPVLSIPGGDSPWEESTASRAGARPSKGSDGVISVAR
jgi:hypothetical protein